MDLTYYTRWTKAALAAAFVLIFCLLGASASSAKPVAAIYGGGPLYSGVTPNIQRNIDDLKGSGFTRVICWCLHVAANGDLIYNDRTVVSNGSYVGDPAWPGYLAQLKQAPTSVDSIYFSVGSGGSQDYTTIQNLISSQGTGPSSILYRNFQALKQVMPFIDGIDLDDEDNLDYNTIVNFSLMQGRLGEHVTFCPFYALDFWMSCLQAVESQSPGLVTGIDLQCYDGGAGNNPGDWTGAIARAGLSTPVYPGLWSLHFDCSRGDSPAQVKTKIQNWKGTGIGGGFMWLYDDILKCGPSSGAYADAILSGLGVSTIRDGVYTLTPRADVGSRLTAADSGTANGTGVTVLSANALANQDWIFTTVSEGVYKIQPSYSTALVLEASGGGAAGSTVDLREDTGGPAQRWSTSLNPDHTIAIKPLSAPQTALDILNGSSVLVTNDTGASGQAWTLSPSGGSYTLAPSHATYLSLDVPGSRSTSGVPVDVSFQNGLPNQSWIWTNVGGVYFKIQPSYAPNLALDVPGIGAGQGASVNISQDSAAGSQRWTPLLNSNGTFGLAPRSLPRLLLEVVSGFVSDGAPLDVSSDYGGANEAWLFVPTPPVLGLITPYQVAKSAAGGVVTITGSNFAPAATVSVNDTIAAAAKYVSSTMMTVTLPASVTSVSGLYFLRVTNPANGLGSNTRNFTVAGVAPVITRLDPGTVAAGATSVHLTITGTGFVTGSRVTFNDGPTIVPVSHTSTQLVVVVPAAAISAAGSVKVVVVNSAGDGGPSNAAALTVSAGLTLTTIAPTAIVLPKTNAVVTLTGTGFISGAHVTLNNTASLDATVVSSTEIHFTLPTPRAGVYDVRVVNTGDGSPSNAERLTVSVAKPVILRLDPGSVMTGASGVSLTISGSGFADGARVTFGSGPAIVPTSVSAAVIVVPVPASAVGSAGSVAVRVLNPSQSGGASESAILTVVARPTLTSIDPNSITVNQTNQLVTLTGAGFVAGAHVTLNNTASFAATVVSATRIQFTIAAPAAGKYDVRVVNPGLEAVSNALPLTVTQARPTIASLDPSTVTAGSPGLSISITGSGFVAESRVTFNGGATVIPTSVSATKIVVSVPAGLLAAPGAVAVRVLNPAISGGSSEPATLTVTAGPRLTGISPSVITLPQTNQLVTLTGTGFLPGAHVTLNGAASFEAVVVSTTQIQFTIAAPAAGKYDVRVVNSSAGPSVSNPVRLTVVSRPSITSLTPNPLYDGQVNVKVTIEGTGFAPGSQVTLDGGASGGVQFVSTTRLVLTLASARTGAYAVRVVNANDGTASEPATLTVLDAAHAQLPAGLSFFSLPFDSGSIPLDTLLGASNVKLAAWVAESASWSVTPQAPANAVHPGRGYWVRLSQGVTVQATGTPVDATQDFSIPLPAGWNAIGDPFFSGVAVSDLKFGSLTYAQASSDTQGVIRPALLQYQGGAYVSVKGGDTLAVGQGYWIYVRKATTLTFPHPAQ